MLSDSNSPFQSEGLSPEVYSINERQTFIGLLNFPFKCFLRASFCWSLNLWAVLIPAVQVLCKMQTEKIPMSFWATRRVVHSAYIKFNSISFAHYLATSTSPWEFCQWFRLGTELSITVLHFQTPMVQPKWFLWSGCLKVLIQLDQSQSLSVQ